LVWARDENGSITYREYDEKLGLLVREIVDLKTTGFSPSPPSGFDSATGLSLEMTYAYAADGKLTSTTDAANRTSSLYYTRLSKGEPVTVRYPPLESSVLTGPVSIEVRDLDGRTVTRAKGVPQSSDAVLSDDWSSALSLEGAFVGELFERTESVYEGGQKVKDLEWTNAEQSGETKYETIYGYDSMGRLARVKDAEGTITRTYYTVQGRVAERLIGTNDYDPSDPLAESTGPNDMSTVELLYYDGGDNNPAAVGDGNLTLRRLVVDGMTNRDTEYAYDFRNRRVTTDGEEAFFEKLDYDNLDRVTARYRYASSESAGNLRAKSTTDYDVRGRVFR